MEDLDIQPFVQVKNVETLLPILETRYPRDVQIHNQIITYPKFKEVMNFYTLGSGITNDTWIISICERLDHGVEINISIPHNPAITCEIREAFKSSKLFNWTKPFAFSMLDPTVSAMIFDISVRDFGNQTMINPNNFYYMDKDVALNLDTRSTKEGIIVRQLDVETGVEFFSKTWKYATERTLPFFREMIAKNPSQGVYHNGKLISAIAVGYSNGTMGFLHTLPDYRNQNYGKMAMEGLIKSQAEQGFIPCSTIEINNLASVSFHGKVGMKFSHRVEYVFYFGAKFD